MTLVSHLRFSGVLLILLGLAHARFGRYLNWRSDLAKLELVNRQIFLVHCFYIALFLVMMGLLCCLLPSSLLQPQPLSQAVLGGMTCVWGIRLLIQWTVFDRVLWRDHQVHRRIHYLLTLLWVYLTTVDGLSLARSLRPLLP
jgi:hypothetical protein